MIVQDTLNNAQVDLAREMSKISTEMSDMLEKRKTVHRVTTDKIAYFDKSVEELKEKAWELDTSTQDMLMFHGIKEDAKNDNIDAAVKEVLKEIT